MTWTHTITEMEAPIPTMGLPYRYLLHLRRDDGWNYCVALKEDDPELLDIYLAEAQATAP